MLLLYIKYDKHNTLKVTINESRINTLLRFGRKHEEKLYNYSLFLNKIIIHNLDKNRTKQHYQNIFDEKDHIGLKNFLDELYNRNYNLIKSNNFTGFIIDLYSRYKKHVVLLKERITNISKKELLISSF